jgi:hypothetical protein
VLREPTTDSWSAKSAVAQVATGVGLSARGDKRATGTVMDVADTVYVALREQEVHKKYDVRWHARAMARRQMPSSPLSRMRLTDCAVDARSCGADERQGRR